MSFYRTHTLTCTPSKLTHYGVVTHNEAEKITRAQRPMSGRMSRTMAWQRARRPQNKNRTGKIQTWRQIGALYRRQNEENRSVSTAGPSPVVQTKSSAPQQNTRITQTRCKNNSSIDIEQGLQSIYGGHHPPSLI
jgi:hypothetical protein